MDELKDKLHLLGSNFGQNENLNIKVKKKINNFNKLFILFLFFFLNRTSPIQYINI